MEEALQWLAHKGHWVHSRVNIVDILDQKWLTRWSMWAPFEKKSPMTQFVHSFQNPSFVWKGLKKFLWLTWIHITIITLETINWKGKIRASTQIYDKNQTHWLEVGFVFVGKLFMWTMETGVLNKLWHSKYLLALPAPRKGRTARSSSAVLPVFSERR